MGSTQVLRNGAWRAINFEQLRNGDIFRMFYDGGNTLIENGMVRLAKTDPYFKNNTTWISHINLIRQDIVISSAVLHVMKTSHENSSGTLLSQNAITNIVKRIIADGQMTPVDITNYISEHDFNRNWGYLCLENDFEYALRRVY